MAAIGCLMLWLASHVSVAVVPIGQTTIIEKTPLKKVTDIYVSDAAVLDVSILAPKIRVTGKMNGVTTLILFAAREGMKIVVVVVPKAEKR